MKHRLPPLDSLKAFEAAARHLSFTIAAEELCITKSAISYQIRKLEAHLQCSLFKRSIRQIYLTDAGQMLLRTTRLTFTELEDTLQRIRADSQSGGVTIAATTYVAARWLSPRISEFNTLYPEIPILLQHSVNSSGFRLEDVDLAIRWGPCDSSEPATRLGAIPMPLYPAISPQLLERHGLAGTAPLDGCQLGSQPLCEIPLLCEDRAQDLWQEWLQSNGNSDQPLLPNPRRLISDANVRVQAAIDGQGFILADNLMLNEFSNNLLVAPFPEKLEGYGYSCLAARDRIENTGARAIKGWMASWMS